MFGFLVKTDFKLCGDKAKPLYKAWNWILKNSSNERHLGISRNRNFTLTKKFSGHQEFKVNPIHLIIKINHKTKWWYIHQLSMVAAY